jgi:hypothetical protein
MVQSTEERKAYMKQWYQKNKERRTEQDKAYKQTPAGRKSNTLNNWKQRGLIHDDYNSLYQQYLQATHCNACKSEFKDSFDKCLDHDHNTNLFRQFLCRGCNCYDNWLRRSLLIMKLASHF